MKTMLPSEKKSIHNRLRDDQLDVHQFVVYLKRAIKAYFDNAKVPTTVRTFDEVEMATDDDGLVVDIHGNEFVVTVSEF